MIIRAKRAGCLVALGVITLPFVLPFFLNTAAADTGLRIVQTLAWMIVLVAVVVVVVTRVSRLISRSQVSFDQEDYLNDLAGGHVTLRSLAQRLRCAAAGIRRCGPPM